MRRLLQCKSVRILSVCVCSLNYTACNTHEPYYHLCPVRLYNIFPRYLIDGTILERISYLDIKCVLISPTNMV